MTYEHTQHSPLKYLLYGFAVLFFVIAGVLRSEPLILWLFPGVGLLMLTLAMSFHYLAVEDQGDRLSISFGPLALFRRYVRYDDIIEVERAQTTLLDGWGIHLSLRGGWVWNIAGRDCVLIRLQRSKLWLGSDDAERLVKFLQGRIERSSGVRDTRG